MYFTVGIAAGIGGFLFLITVVIIIVYVSRKDKREGEINPPESEPASVRSINSVLDISVREPDRRNVPIPSHQLDHFETTADELSTYCVASTTNPSMNPSDNENPPLPEPVVSRNVGIFLEDDGYDDYESITV